MKLRFQEKKILQLAENYAYWREEDALTAISGQIQEAGRLNKSQLKLVARWKAPRSAGHVDKNDESYVKEATSWALSATTERARIEVLTVLDGVRWPTASVILHLFHVEPYPILDFRALWSVGLEVPHQYSFGFWWPYVGFCRQLAERNHVSMRVLDRALWQYSKENQSPKG